MSAVFIGLALRWLFRSHATIDAIRYLIPWYQFARDHGAGALHDAFTNYTPFYSYLLLLAAHFDKLGEPLSLVKAISACFELGSAIVAAEMVWDVTKAPLRSALAFSGVWLAPTILLNGAFWGQADSIWAFFILLSISLFMRHRNGTLPFAAAVAVKAQGVFLGPFVLGMMLRRKLHWAWLLAVPVVYLGVAIPVLCAGRPFASILGIYVGQAETFHSLSMNAANIWVFAGGMPYEIGVPVGLGLAALAGGALSLFLARARRDDPEFIVLAACASLFLMPYLLPKMHDRYFYAFEVASVALACINPRYLVLAVLAQTNGVLAYIALESGTTIGILPAALCNTLVGCYIVLDLWTGERAFHRPVGAWIGFAVSSMALLSDILIHDAGSPPSLVSMLLAGAFVTMAFVLVRESRRAGFLPPNAAMQAGTVVRP